MSQARSGFLQRATQGIAQQLELGQSRKQPNPPTVWNINTHHKYLIALWDKIVEAAATNSRYPQSRDGQLDLAQQKMILTFPELGGGQVTLSQDWMAYVLGKALRHPFCTTQENMGRWEVLASSSGSRGTWGPW